MSEELDFIEMPDLSDVVPPVAVKAAEYELCIVNSNMSTDTNGHPYILPRFRIINELNAKTFTKYLQIPTPDLDEDQLLGVQHALRFFEDCFGIPPVGGQLTKEALKGLKGRAILKVVGQEEDEFGIQNEVARWLPKE